MTDHSDDPDDPDDPDMPTGNRGPAAHPDDADGPGPSLTSFDPGLQAERTALAWERTGFSMMAAGVLFGRYAVTDAHEVLAAGGVAQMGLGAGLLMWAGFRYWGMQGPLWADEPVVHPTAARIVGLATIVFTALALLLAILLGIARLG